MSQATPLHRIEVALKPNVRDTLGEKAARKIKSELGIEVGPVRII